MISRNASKTGSAAGIVVKPQKGTTLKVMPAPNVEVKPFCVLSHQSGNLLTNPRICLQIYFPLLYFTWLWDTWVTQSLYQLADYKKIYVEDWSLLYVMLFH